MQKTLEEQIDRAKELLKIVKHAAMATVNADGSPHNTPFMFMHDPELKHIYWGSHPDSKHSKNVMRTGRLFVVLYDAMERGGLFIRATDAHLLEGEELKVALKIHNELRQSRGQSTLPIDYYIGASPQRMWSASIAELWVNGTQRDAEGLIVKDIRTEVTAADLIK